MSRLRYRAFTTVAAIAALLLVGAQGAAFSAPAHAVESATAPRPVPSDGPWTPGASAPGGVADPVAPGDASARSLVAPQVQRTLAATRTISGTVHLPSGAPTDWYQGVWVYAMDDAGYQAGAAPTNAAGAYSITGLAPGSYTLRVISDVYVDAWNNDVAPNLVDQISPSMVDVTGADAGGRDFTLQQGTTISGSVDIWAAGDAVLLEVYTTDGTLVSRKSIQSEYVDAGGASFTITGVPAGDFLIGATLLTWNGAEWWWHAHAYLTDSDRTEPPHIVTVSAGNAVNGISRFMGRPSTVTGTMVTYGFAGSNGEVLADTPVFEKIADGSWARLPWYWNSNAVRENGTTPFLLKLGQGTFRFGFQQPDAGAYTGNNPVTGTWFGGAGSFDTATDLKLYYAETRPEVCGSVHPASVRFTDVPADYSFLKEISWMASKGITTGYAGECGTKSFNPWGNVTRDAMAAFLYRYAGSPAVTLPDSSPFIDADPSHPFYKEIVWLSTQRITNGWSTPSGTEYRPSQPITRDAMAAFLYRYADKPTTTPPDTSPFADVATDNPFYNEITWLASAGISTGWSTADGKEYRPYNNITRDAMAAFLYRYDSKH